MIWDSVVGFSSHEASAIKVTVQVDTDLAVDQSPQDVTMCSPEGQRPCLETGSMLLMVANPNKQVGDFMNDLLKSANGSAGSSKNKT